jgi:hypothetical protein
MLVPPLLRRSDERLRRGSELPQCGSAARAHSGLGPQRIRLENRLQQIEKRLSHIRTSTFVEMLPPPAKRRKVGPKSDAHEELADAKVSAQHLTDAAAHQEVCENDSGSARAQLVRCRERSKRPKVPPALFIIENSIDLLSERNRQQERHNKCTSTQMTKDHHPSQQAKNRPGAGSQDSKVGSQASKAGSISRVDNREKQREMWHKQVKEEKKKHKHHTPYCRICHRLGFCQHALRDQSQQIQRRRRSTRSRHLYQPVLPPTQVHTRAASQSRVVQPLVQAQEQKVVVAHLPPTSTSSEGSFFSIQDPDDEIFEFVSALTRRSFLENWNFKRDLAKHRERSTGPECWVSWEDGLDSAHAPVGPATGSPAAADFVGEARAQVMNAAEDEKALPEFYGGRVGYKSRKVHGMPSAITCMGMPDMEPETSAIHTRRKSQRGLLALADTAASDRISATPSAAASGHPRAAGSYAKALRAQQRCRDDAKSCGVGNTVYGSCCWEGGHYGQDVIKKHLTPKSKDMGGHKHDHHASAHNHEHHVDKNWASSERKHDRHAESQQRRRQKDLVVALDKLLPDTYHSDCVKDCGGRRSLGMEGRSLHDVLSDTTKCLRAMRTRDEGGDADAGSPSTQDEPTHAGHLSSAAIRDGLMSSYSLAVMELEMPSWTVLSLNPAAKELLGDTPWGSCEGQCLVNSFVHCHDVSILEDLWSEAQSVSKTHDPPSQGPPQGANTSRRTIRFSTYHSHDPVLVKRRHGENVASEVDVSMERDASSATNLLPMMHCLPDPFVDCFVPDKDVGAAKEFEPANVEACEEEKGDIFVASNFARDKSKKAGRKFISCHYVAAQVQLLSIASQRCSSLSMTWQVHPLDTSADQVAAGGEGSTGPRVQAHAHTYKQAQLNTLKPCSRCKAQRKGVAYCLRLGHISVLLSSLRKKEGMGGKLQGMRALLLISRVKHAALQTAWACSNGAAASASPAFLSTCSSSPMRTASHCTFKPVTSNTETAGKTSAALGSSTSSIKVGDGLAALRKAIALSMAASGEDTESQGHHHLPTFEMDHGSSHLVTAQEVMQYQLQGGKWCQKPNQMQPWAELVGERVRVYWDGEGEWFAGHVSRYCARKKQAPFFVQYDDGDAQWENFKLVQWMKDDNQPHARVQVATARILQFVFRKRSGKSIRLGPYQNLIATQRQSTLALHSLFKALTIELRGLRAQNVPREVADIGGRQLLGQELIGRRLRMLWAAESEWFFGTMIRFCALVGHVIEWDDREVSVHDLSSEIFEWISEEESDDDARGHDIARGSSAGMRTISKLRTDCYVQQSVRAFPSTGLHRGTAICAVDATSEGRKRRSSTMVEAAAAHADEAMAACLEAHGHVSHALPPALCNAAQARVSILAPPTMPAQSSRSSAVQTLPTLVVRDPKQVKQVEQVEQVKQVELEQARLDMDEATRLLGLVKKCVLQRKLEIFQQTHAGRASVSHFIFADSLRQTLKCFTCCAIYLLGAEYEFGLILVYGNRRQASTCDQVIHYM